MSELDSSKELTRIKQEQAELDQIRNELKESCGQIDHRHWVKNNYMIGIAECVELPEDSLPSNDQPLLGSVCEFYLARNGRIFLTLQHREFSEQVYFAEILREATLDEYRENKPFALDKLDLIEKSASHKAFLKTEKDMFNFNGTFVTIPPVGDSI